MTAEKAIRPSAALLIDEEQQSDAAPARALRALMGWGVAGSIGGGGCGVSGAGDPRGAAFGLRPAALAVGALATGKPLALRRDHVLRVGR
jgi:hypothetical protein